MIRPKCEKCGGKLIYEPYPMENMLVTKCFVCGKIGSYYQLSQEQARKLFRKVDRAAAA